MNLNLHIERLILDGLPVSHAQGPILSAALERELARLLANGGLEASLQSGGAWRSVPVSPLQLTTGNPPLLGQQIARAVHQGIGQAQSSSARSQQDSSYVHQR